MRLKCIHTSLTREQERDLGRAYRADQDFHVTIGREYVAMGLNFSMNSNVHGTGVWVHLVTDFGNLAWAPVQLFDIIDARVSKYWIARQLDHVFTLWPESFYRQFYHDDLLEGVPEVVNDFQRVRSLLEAEAASPEAAAL